MMMMKKNSNTRLLFSSLVVMTFCWLIACQTTPPAPAESTGTDSTMQSTTAASFDVAMVNNGKDPVCGMPVTAGISDTAHFQGNVLGFCSPECKAEFVKDPAALIAAAEIKKK
jgi:YHS domain-containing protein